MTKLFLVGFLAFSTFTTSVETVNTSRVLGAVNSCPTTTFCQTLPECQNATVQKDEMYCTENIACDISAECTTCPVDCPPTPSCPCVCE